MPHPVPLCAHCGSPLTGGARFCPHCGTSVAAPAAPAGACDVCGHVNDPPGTFCGQCGARLGAAGAAPAGPSGSAPGTPRPVPFRREPWHYAAAALLAGVIVLFVWIEAARVPDPGTARRPAAAAAPAANSADAELARLEQAVAANPADTAALLGLANRLHDLSRRDPALIEPAIARYRQYLAMKPGDPDARVDLGIMYFERARTDSAGAAGHVDAAVAEMETVARAHPEHQAAALNLGIVNLNAGRSEEALRWFRRTVEIAPQTDLGQRAARLLGQHGGAAPAR